MNTITHRTKQLTLYGAALALTALILTVLAVTMAGGAQAQSESYEDPHPCGQGFDDFYDLPEFPVDQVSSGHYAIFDAFYDLDADEPHRPTEPDEAWAGVLSLNLCPPQLVEGQGRNTTTVITRHESNIDIGRTVFHVGQAAHILTADEVTAYPFLGDAGDQVYWLRVGDDPNTSATEQASGLQFSFSTALFDDIHWYLKDEQDNSVEPFWYEIEAVRELGVHPKEYGHIYLFDDSPAPENENNENKEAVWNSAESDTGRIDMQPGEYWHPQWVFSKPGTYELAVHLNAHVRRDEPDDFPEDETWHPASEEDVVTSQVKKYIFQVGDLTLNEPPQFQIERSVGENTAAGTVVGDLVSVVDPDGDPLLYTLSGPGSELFNLAGDDEDSEGRFATTPSIVTATDELDHEVLSKYVLTLEVSDGKDHESNPYPWPDAAMLVKVNVTDVDETDVGADQGVTIVPSSTEVSTGESVILRADIGDLPSDARGIGITWQVEDPAGTLQCCDVDYLNDRYRGAVAYKTAGTRVFHAILSYTYGHLGYSGVSKANPVQVTWTN